MSLLFWRKKPKEKGKSFLELWQDYQDCCEFSDKMLHSANELAEMVNKLCKQLQEAEVKKQDVGVRDPMSYVDACVPSHMMHRPGDNARFYKD